MKDFSKNGCKDMGLKESDNDSNITCDTADQIFPDYNNPDEPIFSDEYDQYDIFKLVEKMKAKKT